MNEAIIAKLPLWDRETLDVKCGVVGNLGDLVSEDDYSHFVYVPYDLFATKGDPMKAYRADKWGRVAVFLVRVDLSDVRHVVVGFQSDADRQAFLETEGIIIPRARRYAD
jgi:hypothetical protein